MTDAIFDMDEELYFTHPIPHGATIYSISGCWKCEAIRDDIQTVYPAIAYINCDEYIKKDKEAFKSHMFGLMQTRPKDDKLRFPVVFVDGQYISNFETHIISDR
jgi:glutaredoxin